MKELLVNDQSTGTYFDEHGNMYGNVETILDEKPITRSLTTYQL